MGSQWRNVMRMFNVTISSRRSFTALNLVISHKIGEGLGSSKSVTNLIIPLVS